MREKLFDALRARETRLVRFLQDIVRIRSVSTEERQVVERIGQEMESVGFDEVRIDGMGNVLGRIGKGRFTIAMDAHVDTVDVDSEQGWQVPPFEARLEDGQLWGRGAVDQKAGMAALVHAGGLIKELGLEDDFTLIVSGTVQEEDCDGLCWLYLIQEEKVRPDCVVITEPTDLNLYIGHRGRMEIKVRTRGRAAHGSAPERGINAVYSMSRIVQEIERLNERLPVDPQLGRGSVAVTHIACETPSLCSVPDEATIHLDRRVTLIDTRESVLAEVREAIERAGEQAEVFVPDYERPSHTGLLYRGERYFPAWLLQRDDPLLAPAVSAYKAALDRDPVIGTWVFSTNGVATRGRHGIPTIGLGPGDERLAHAVNERVPVEQVVAAAAWYAAFPQYYARAMSAGTAR